uniref:(northern house mosquito) hypothetical protein n=1 Tax=Culex pipiens TaxID=7175 RepID=A0A8D8G0I5_CULPI
MVTMVSSSNCFSKGSLRYYSFQIPGLGRRPGLPGRAERQQVSVRARQVPQHQEVPGFRPEHRLLGHQRGRHRRGVDAENARSGVVGRASLCHAEADEEAV